MKKEKKVKKERWLERPEEQVEDRRESGVEMRIIIDGRVILDSSEPEKPEKK